MPAELNPAEVYLFSRLSGDATLAALVPGGFHSERYQTAPAGAYVIWSYSGSAPDTMGEHGARIITHPLYLVRVIDAVSDFGVLEPAAARIDVLLHIGPPQSVVVAGSTYLVQYSYRETPYSRDEHLIDIERRHLGGYYRLIITPG